MITCISCPTRLHYKEAHTAHWIGRANKKYRWDEENCRPACPSCNVYRQQEHQQVFTLRQIERLGIDQVNQMLGDK